jgi:FkbM family methyltransferase
MLLFDVGANVGLWALANQDNHRVICVEASPKTFAKLTENVKTYSNIECIHLAISNKTCE